MRKIIRNKRGATLDNIYVMIQLFAFALFILIMFKIWGEFTSDNLDSELWDKTSQGSHARDNTTVAINNMDWIFLVAYFGMHIGIIVLAFILKSHPIMYVAGIFIIIILAMIAAPLSNVWDTITLESSFITPAASMPKTNFIMDKLPLFEVVFAFLTLIAFAAFAKGEGYL